MFYYEFRADTPYCGTDCYEYHIRGERPSEEELEQMAQEFCLSNAESFEYLVFGWDNDPVGDGTMTEEEYQNELDWYYESCSCEWREITEEEYEGIEL